VPGPHRRRAHQGRGTRDSGGERERRRLPERVSPTRKPLLAVLALAVAAGAGCDDSPTPSPTPGPPGKGKSGPKAAKKTEWSTDEMAADPEGYLVWADEQLGAQVELREER